VPLLDVSVGSIIDFTQATVDNANTNILIGERAGAAEKAYILSSVSSISN
jgi:hypothetical protein